MQLVAGLLLTSLEACEAASSMNLISGLLPYEFNWRFAQFTQVHIVVT